MKAALLIVLRLLFVAVYSISVGLLTGWIWMKIVQAYEKRHWKARQKFSTAA